MLELAKVHKLSTLDMVVQYGTDKRAARRDIDFRRRHQSNADVPLTRARTRQARAGSGGDWSECKER